jgi:hypothetical protein
MELCHFLICWKFTVNLKECLAAILSSQDKGSAIQPKSKKIAVYRSIFMQDIGELVPDCTTS